MEQAGVVGVDVGGTFIDFVAVDSDGTVRTHKELSDPRNLADAFLRGVIEVAPGGAGRWVHGTTVATNALLERRGAKVGLLATEGFADVLAIGRQNRPDLYALSGRRPSPLVPRERRLDIPERVGSDGDVLHPLDETAVKEAARALAEAGVEAVAVSFLFSFLHPGHETRVGELVAAELGDEVLVCLSSDVLPEYREYERTSTTVATAYVGPLLDRYIGQVAAGVDGPFQVMQSNGGVIDASEAAKNGAALVLSGPAGGVVGAFETARQAGYDQVITFDMGGTSTDVALCPGTVPMTVETTVAEVPIRLPMIDIHTIGAGGGSIARVDAGGALRVGPESAGADPGPAAYGRGWLPTVTDADLVLGRLAANATLGGSIQLDLERARHVLRSLGQELGLEGPSMSRDPSLLAAAEAALGVLRVVHAAMHRAIRRVSVERGQDPRRCILVAFGGAGPMHAAELADELDIARVLIPPFPGVESACGMATADELRDFSRTVKTRVERDDASGLAELWRPLLAETDRFDSSVVRSSADVRYVGQSFEIEVPAGDSSAIVDQFDEAHERLYGFAQRQAAVEIVNVRARAITPSHVRLRSRAPSEAGDERWTTMRFASGEHRARLVERDTLGALERLEGPALVVQPDTTTVVPPGWSAAADGFGNLVLQAVT